MSKKEYKDIICKEVIREDKRRPFLWVLLKGLFLNPTQRALYFIFRMQYLFSKKDRISRLLASRYQMKLVTEFGIHIGRDSVIGKGLMLPHPTGIVIGNKSIIGDNCRIFQGVTIGGARIGDSFDGTQPTIGKNVTLFSGAKVLGGIRVSDYTEVGANSVLLCDTIKGGVYVGIPARLVKQRSMDHN